MHFFSKKLFHSKKGTTFIELLLYIAIFLAITPILVKVGTVMLNAPILAVAISYTAVLPPYLALIVSRKFRKYVLHINNESLKYLTLAPSLST